jgi:hypothetical protein
VSALLALILATAGAAALALSKDGHHRQVFARSTKHPRRWRWMGGLAWTASLVLCGVSDGWALGVVHWLGLITLASVVTMTGLAFASKPNFHRAEDTKNAG